MGRPRRSHRETPTPQYSTSRTNTPFRGTAEPLTPSASVVQDVVMPSDALGALSDPLDFLQWFPEHSSMDFLSPEPCAAPHIEVSPETLGSDARLDSQLSADLSAASSADHSFGPTRLLTQLCDVNVALCQHPLWTYKDKLTQSPISDQISPAYPELKLADLGIGKLLGTTSQLRDTVNRIRLLGEGPKAEFDDPSTALVVLSCYKRLDILYARTLEIMRRVRDGEQKLGDLHLLMPNMRIDGFSVAGCYDLQLTFLIHAYEKAHSRLVTCISTCGQALLEA